LDGSEHYCKLTPAEATPLTRDANGAECNEDFNVAAVVGQLLYLSTQGLILLTQSTSLRSICFAGIEANRKVFEGYKDQGFDYYAVQQHSGYHCLS
jgi:hypothetical protein